MKMQQNEIKFHFFEKLPPSWKCFQYFFMINKSKTFPKSICILTFDITITQQKITTTQQKITTKQKFHKKALFQQSITCNFVQLHVLFRFIPSHYVLFRIITLITLTILFKYVQLRSISFKYVLLRLLLRSLLKDWNLFSSFSQPLAVDCIFDRLSNNFCYLLDLFTYLSMDNCFHLILCREFANENFVAIKVSCHILMDTNFGVILAWG